MPFFVVYFFIIYKLTLQKKNKKKSIPFLELGSKYSMAAFTLHLETIFGEPKHSLMVINMVIDAWNVSYWKILAIHSLAVILDSF